MRVCACEHVCVRVCVPVHMRVLSLPTHIGQRPQTMHHSNHSHKMSLNPGRSLPASTGMPIPYAITWLNAFEDHIACAFGNAPEVELLCATPGVDAIGLTLNLSEQWREVVVSKGRDDVLGALRAQSRASSVATAGACCLLLANLA